MILTITYSLLGEVDAFFCGYATSAATALPCGYADNRLRRSPLDVLRWTRW
jgi:hypothetical protein